MVGRIIAWLQVPFKVGESFFEGSTLCATRAMSLGIATTLVLISCAYDQPTAESLCLDAVGELQASFQVYERLLDGGVEQMRDDDSAE